MGADRVRAAVMRRVGEPVEVVDVELDAPRAGEVRVRLHASGVCHSDLSIIEGRIDSPVPAVMGHEGAGVVEAVGDGVTRVRPGDHVIVSWVATCHRCFYCLRGQHALCMSGISRPGLLDDGTARFHRDGEALHHGLNAATWAEATVVRESAAIPIDASVPLDVAAVVGCAVTTGVGAVVHTARVRPGERVVVIGLGGVGLSVVQGCRLAGAERIIVVDPVEEKRETALRLGATDVLPEADVRAVRGMTDRIGPDVVFEVVGNAALQRLAFDMTRRGGRAVMVGVPQRDTETSFPSLLLSVSEKTIHGCFYGSSMPERDFPWILNLYRAGRLDLEALITSRAPLDGVNDALDAMRQGRQVRTLLTLA